MGGSPPLAPPGHDAAQVMVRGALEGKRPQRRPQRRLGRRLEEVAKAVGGGYCRLQPLPSEPPPLHAEVLGSSLD